MHVLFPTPRRMSVNRAASEYSFFVFNSYLAMQKIKNTSMDDSIMDFIFCYAVWGGCFWWNAGHCGASLNAVDANATLHTMKRYGSE